MAARVNRVIATGRQNKYGNPAERLYESLRFVRVPDPRRHDVPLT